MSREIDTSDLGSLSDADLLYLRDRGRLTPEQEEQYLGDDYAPTRQGGGRQRPPRPTGETTGDTGTGPDDSGNEDENGVDYDEWDRKALLAELKDRDLDTKGAHDVLVQRLLDDDAQRAEEAGA